MQIGFIRAFVRIKDNLQVKVQQLWRYSTIPAHFHSTERILKSNRKYLWLVDEHFVIIPTTRIQNQVEVWLMDQPEIEEREYSVDEILYQHNRLWKI